MRLAVSPGPGVDCRRPLDHVGRGGEAVFFAPLPGGRRKSTQPRLAQPGPVLQPRWQAWRPGPQRWTPRWREGLSLLEAVARPLRDAGFASAAVELQGGGFGPFAYMLPAHAPDATHVAWYSAAHEPAGGARLERGNVTFGQRNGEAWLHCHAIWQKPPAAAPGMCCRRKRLLPHRSPPAPGASPAPASRWDRIGDELFLVSTRADARTGGRHPRPGAARPPNEDLVVALETACRTHGFTRAALRGGVGSLVSPRFAEGTGTATSPPNCWSPAAA